MKTNLLLTFSLAWLVMCAQAQIIVSELHYNPLDELINNITVSGDAFEFIELKNTSNSDFDLSGASFTSGFSYTFPQNTIIKSNSYLVLCSDLDTLELFYAIKAYGQFESGKLSNKGEKITLVNKDSVEIFEFTYNDASPWPEAADGFGFSLVLISDDADMNLATSWRASSVKNGTPGYDEPEISIPPIKINEIIANTTCPSVDAIELYNPTDSTVDIGGWYLTDLASNPTKWTIPAGTKIDAKSVMVFYAGTCNGLNVISSAQQFGSAFSLSSHGEEIFIFSGSNGSLTGYSHGFEFGETLPETSLGRIETSINKEYFVELNTINLGSISNTPKSPAIAIEEINYNPSAYDFEFLKITNTTDSVIVYDKWDIGGIGFEKDSFIGQLAAGESLYIVEDSIDISLFCQYRGISSNSLIYTFSGSLSNSSEIITIERPGTVYIDNEDTVTPYYIVDIVEYMDASPWPENTDGDGEYLIRVHNTAFGSEPANWKASTIAAPVASVGSVNKKMVALNSVVSLDGSESYDINYPDITLDYKWEFYSKPQSSNATLSNSNSVSPSFTCDVSGLYIITLTVSNSIKTSIPDTIYVYENEYYISTLNTINNEKDTEYFEIYPTITNQKVYYSIANKTKQINIYTSTGLLYKEIIPEHQKGSILFEQKGVYYIEAVGDETSKPKVIICK